MKPEFPSRRKLNPKEKYLWVKNMEEKMETGNKKKKKDVR